VLRLTATRNLLHASVVLFVSLAYLSYVFQLFDEYFRVSGLGDWLDAYFINALLEHWFRSATTGADPSSPPMYFPVQGTLAYSHGLILYAPLYLLLRPFLHPFHAYTVTLFALMETGILCLYLLLRKLELSFIESLSLAALFFTSKNVVNGSTSQWSQRASVFLIPPILLLLVVSARMRPGRGRLLLAGSAAFLSTLLYVQDFYTAHFALLFTVFFAAAVAFVDGRPRETIAHARASAAAFWRSQSSGSRLAIMAVALTSGWAWLVWMSGGGELNLWGVRVRSHDWRRPALIALAAFMVFIGSSRRLLVRARVPKPSPWLSAVAVGAAAGAIVFLWIYLGVYRELRAFPEDHLLKELVVRDPSRWVSPLNVARDLGAYSTLRSFALVFVVGTLVWIPQFKVDRKTRVYCLWFLAISFLVLLIPLRLRELSVWRSFFEWLPGFGVIRDPKRVIYLYELAVVLAAALFLGRFPMKSNRRISVTLFVLVLLAAERNREVFHYKRPIDAFERWVAAPIDVDPRCKSFYVKGASGEYMSRAPHMWSLYNVDSLFVSLNHRIPTLNGYSAWDPDEWHLHNPQEAGYAEHVTNWIAKHRLASVCEFDIDARTMKVR
jgi:hypothetical protein